MEALVHKPADHLGIGVFESFILSACAPKHRKVIALDRHIARLTASAAALGLSAPSSVEIKAAILERLARCHEASSQRLLARCILRESGLSVSIEPWSPTLDANAGTGAALYRGERVVPQHKSCSAIISHLARQEANRRGYGEALLVDRAGFVREGAWSNFFILRHDQVLITPAQQILPGITRQLVLEFAAQIGLKVEHYEITVPLLFSESSEIFITHATNGIVPLVRIEALPIGSSKVGRITRTLQAMYRDYSAAKLAY